MRTVLCGGALEIIDGKARLVSEVYCDDLGACLGECPQDAITVEERPAKAFDAAAVQKRLQEIGREAEEPGPAPAARAPDAHAFGCPGARTMALRKAEEECVKPEATLTGKLKSELGQWPVKLYLVCPHAPYFQNAELLLAAEARTRKAGARFFLINPSTTRCSSGPCARPWG